VSGTGGCGERSRSAGRLGYGLSARRLVVARPPVTDLSVTTTPSVANTTSTIDAPGRRNSRLNAVLARTSPSFASR